MRHPLSAASVVGGGATPHPSGGCGHNVPGRSRLGYDLTVIIGGFIAICVVLLILAFLAPRLSRYPQRGVDKGLGMGSRTGSKAPGKLGKWLPKPFNTGMKAANKSAKKRREARSKLPL